MTLKRRIARALEGHDPAFGRWVAAGMYGAILASALIITFLTLPDLPDGLRRLLYGAELCLLGVFTLEYALRLWSAPDRRRYALGVWGLIDLMSVLPALLFLVPDSQVLRTLRLLRVFRLLKLLRLRRALLRLERALRESREELILFGFLAAIILFLSAVGIYHFERAAQPEAFGSIPAALWWALATLTTVGYGDVYPITPGGRLFTGLVLLVGLGIVAIPASVLTSALMRPTRSDDDCAQNHPPHPDNDRDPE